MPPLGGVVTFQGPPTGETVALNWHGNPVPGTMIHLCATPTTPCYDPTPVCMDILPPPYLYPVPSFLTVCSGDEVVFEWQGPPDQHYTWSAQPNGMAIGAPQQGSGDLIFIAQNPTNMTIWGSGHITPALGGCTGVGLAWGIYVNPKPSMNQPDNITVCGGSPVSVTFSSATPTTTFSWTNDNPAIGLPPSGTGNINYVSPKVPGPQTATITVTPQYTNGITCPGDPVTFQITLTGSSVDDPPDITVCPGTPVSVAFSGNAASYSWANSNTTIGLAASGSGDIAFNADGSPLQQTAIVTVTPQPCPFVSQNFSITVLPEARVNQPDNVTVCGGQPAPVSVFLSGSSGTTFNWTNSNTAIGLPAAGSGNIIFPVPNVSATQTATITITPVRGACTGEPVTFQITVERCCATEAGSLDTATIGVCGPKMVAVKHLGNQNLEPNDTIRYILYTNPANPLGSVIQYSDSLFFPFLPDTMHFDSVYYAAVIAGNHLPNDSIDAADPCLSLVRGPKIVWWKKPSIAVNSPPDAVCRDGCVEVLFELEGQPPFEFTWQVSQGTQVLMARQVTTSEKQLVVLVCPQDFDVPPVPNGGLLGFMVSNFGDKVCWCGE
ncbi:MAG: hypothetical protein JNJ90_20105 [Saprospiraceae bacterium]|nr:hypothetical protein [Saprospiraceae bacterium]